MIVADASPLIAFERIGLFQLLPQLYDGVVTIPTAVANEVLRSDYTFTPGHPDWLIERSAEDSELMESLRLQLGAGESEAIALAIELNSDLLIDERLGRRIASSMGIRVTGTIGALLEAKRHALIPSLSDALEQLQGAGFFLSSPIIDELRRAAGED